MDLETVMNQRNLETTATTIEVVVIKDKETMMEVQAGNQTLTEEAVAAMEAGAIPLIRLGPKTNGVLKDPNLKLKVAGVIKKNRKKKPLELGMVEARENPMVEEMIGVIKETPKNQMVMEVAAGAEHPLVYKIEIKFTVSF